MRGVVADVDEATVRHRLLGDPRRRRRGERSLSGLALMLGLRGRTPDLAHHEIRFPADYDAEFDDVFRSSAGPSATPRSTSAPRA